MDCLYSNFTRKSGADLSTATQANAGIEIKSILAEDCVPLRSGLAVIRSSVHNVTQLRYIPQRNATQELASYCEPALKRAQRGRPGNED